MQICWFRLFTFYSFYLYFFFFTSSWAFDVCGVATYSSLKRLKSVYVIFSLHPMKIIIKINCVYVSIFIAVKWVLSSGIILWQHRFIQQYKLNFSFYCETRIWPRFWLMHNSITDMSPSALQPRFVQVHRA